ncbi:MFS transporter [Tumebacillus algifaecis]|nr:MFS transporter [Tumebacillus algifaecis]
MSSPLFVPLKNRSYRMLWTGDLLSSFGNWLDLTALIVLLVYHWQLGPNETAILMLTLGVPMVFLGPMLSVYVDRLPLRGLMLICIGIRVLLITGLLFVPNFYLLLPLVFLRSAIGTLFFPARQAMIRHIVPLEQIPGAISLGQMTMSLTMIVAPAIGGALVTVIGPRSLFGIEAVLMALSLLFIWQLPTIPRKQTSAQPASIDDTEAVQAKRSFWNDLKEGFAHIFTVRILTVGLTLITIGMFLVYLYDGLLAIWAKEQGIVESGYGTLMSVIGVGSVTGALLAGQFPRWRKSPLTLIAIVGMLAGGLNMLIGLGGLHVVQFPLVIWAIIFLFFGLFGAAATVPFGYILQTETPKELIGRVSSVSSSMQSAATLLAPTIGATFANLYGTGSVFFGSGAFMLVLALLTLLLMRLIKGDQSKRTPVATSSSYR